MHVADFHIHTDHSSDGAVAPGDVVKAASDAGLTCIAICDHGTLSGARVARSVAAESGMGLTVVVGEEIRTTEGEIIGYFLEEVVSQGMSPEETVAAIKSQGGLTCVPHPFDRFRRSPLRTQALERVAAHIDLVEGFNSRNLLSSDNARALEWANARGIRIVAGSDAHTRLEIGNVRVELPQFDDAQGLLTAVALARVQARGSGVLPHMVTAWAKRSRKSPR